MKNEKLKIGIVGCGNIGSSLTGLVKERLASQVRLVAFCDIDQGKARLLRKKAGCGKVVLLPELVRMSDLIVEAAGAKVSFDVASRALRQGKDVMVLSVGGVLGKERLLFETARKNGAKVYFPSGAICGLDGLKALVPAGIKAITLKTMKAPEALEGADYVVRNKIDLGSLRSDTVIYQGAAKDAVKAFPQNINVVALLSIAARGTVAPTVEIVASPGLKKNIHAIEIKSKAADLKIVCENVPSPDNPKTSYLAVLSAFSVIAGARDAARIGS